MNKQLSELSVESMTLSAISDEDKRNYGITDIDLSLIHIFVIIAMVQAKILLLFVLVPFL